MKPPRPRSPRKPKGRGAERREEILAAVLRLVAEHGAHGVSTRRIAEAAGLSQPALYAYFATREDIVDELAARAFAALEARVAADLAGAPVVMRLGLLARAYIDFGLENPDAYRVAFMIERPPRRGGARDGGVGNGVYALLRREVCAHCARAGVANLNPDTLAESCWAQVHGLVSLLIARPDFPWRDRRALIETHLALITRTMAQIAH
jgi:AcrR family transcriptional regulator